jgi:hypothetical protein
MFVCSDAMQVNLEPENDHEKRFVEMLKATSGRVTLHQGVDIAPCRGGWVRDFGESSKTLAIHIDTAAPATVTVQEPTA